jgi:3-oxoadipate enol-lactonase
VFEKQDGMTDSGIHYRVVRSATSKDPLVLVYGYGGNIGMWPVRLLERLAEKFVVVCLDNRGAGQSACPRIPTEYTVEIMANDVDAVVETLKLPKFHLLGYSLGGCIAIQYAATHQSKVKSLFLLATTGGGSLWSKPPVDQAAILKAPKGDTLWDMYVSVWETTMSAEALKQYDSTLRELFENSKTYITPNEALMGHLNAFRNFDGSPLVQSIGVPTVVFCGADDRLIPAQNSRNLANQLPHAKLVQVPNCEHYPHVEAQELLLSEICALCTAAG